MEALLESGRQRLEGLIDAAISDGSSRGDGGSCAGVGGAGAELTRLWQEGKEQLTELAGKGGEVRANQRQPCEMVHISCFVWGMFS